jgi:hypothetical protein
MTDRDLLDDLLAKLREMEEQLCMAQLETIQGSLLASRLRHLNLLALYIRSKLQDLKDRGEGIQAPASPEPRRPA